MNATEQKESKTVSKRTIVKKRVAKILHHRFAGQVKTSAELVEFARGSFLPEEIDTSEDDYHEDVFAHDVHLALMLGSPKTPKEIYKIYSRSNSSKKREKLEKEMHLTSKEKIPWCIPLWRFDKSKRGLWFIMPE